MYHQSVQEMLDLWRERGVTLEEGLSDMEVANIETEYGFRFPPDLRAVLKEAQPTSHGFTDWRNTHSAGLRASSAEPVEGVLGAVRAGTFWFPQWGERPTDEVSALHVAQEGLQVAPTLIPFWGGIYIPDDPPEDGNPLFSVNDFDIVYIAESLYALAKRSRLGGWLSDTTGPMRDILLWGATLHPGRAVRSFTRARDLVGQAAG